MCVCLVDIKETVAYSFLQFFSWMAITFSNSRSYNKTERDFTGLRQYNDYLEEVETIGKSTTMA